MAEKEAPEPSPPKDVDDNDDGDDDDDTEEESSEEESSSDCRAKAIAEAKKTKEDDSPFKDGGGGINVRRYADLIGIFVVMCGLAIPLIMGDGRDKPPRLEVVALDQSFYKTILYPEKPVWDKYGPNDKDVSWAVFFHKPYCGACRRVRPVFHALAKTTNSSEHLRFASVDCVKYRVFCSRENVDREPLIRLYQAIDFPKPPSAKADDGGDGEAATAKKKTKKSGNAIKFVRKGVADWKGVLVAYEVLAWFKGLQQGPLRGKAIKWGSDDAIAREIEAFKATKDHTGADPEQIITAVSTDPSGFHRDIESALMLGLVDDVFGSHAKILSGKRLETLVNFLEVLSHTYPTKEMRVRTGELRQALSEREAWLEPAYNGLLKRWGHREPSPVGDDTETGAPSLHYKWCRSGGAPGVGGYPCGLWLLFHTMLANSDGKRAHLALQIVYEWTQSFYGCVECAVNFNTEWDDERGEEMFGHVGTSLWLWRIHNLVRARLTEDDDTLAPKPQWPSPAECKPCYNNDTLIELGLAGTPAEGTAEFTVAATAAGAGRVQWDEGAWSDEYVFAFLQETFCAGSDTFVCAGFINP